MNRPVTLIEPGTVKLERLLPGPVERVWAYITESDKRAKWICGGEWDLRVGGKVILKWDHAKLPNNGPTPPQTTKRPSGSWMPFNNCRPMSSVRSSSRVDCCT